MFYSFQFLISGFRDTKDHPWQLGLDQTLVDSRNQNDPLPLQKFDFTLVTTRFVKFKLISFYGLGGGLQYFNIYHEIR